MDKRVIMVHGWGGSPENAWFPWLKRELEKNDFKVLIPAMPNPDAPEIKAWVEQLAKTVGPIESETYFVGHSIGCQTILRYLEGLEAGQRIAGIVFVAGFFRLNHLETVEEKTIAKPWLETKIDCAKVRSHTDKILAVYSDNDPDVDLDESELFRNYLNAETVLEHNKGHFSDDAGVTELPIVLQTILAWAKVC